MRKLVIALCLAAVSSIYMDRYALAADMSPVHKAQPAEVAQPLPPGPSRYYSDYWNYGFWSGYGPFADCDGGRCYISVPYVHERHARRHYGQFYYGPTGGYYHDSNWSYRN